MRITAATASASCLIFTFKEGLLSPIAHDLRLRVTQFSIELDPAKRTVEAHFTPSSLRVECALHAGQELPLSASDRRDIERHLIDDVLEPSRFSDIRFSGSQIGDEISGTLSLHGHTQPLRFRFSDDGQRYHAEIALHQPDFAIRPYSALLGTLRVRADVRVHITVPK